MAQYKIIWFFTDEQGRRREKNRETQEAENAEAALRAYFGKSAAHLKFEYDSARDEAVSYGIPALKTQGWTAKRTGK